MPWKYCAEPWCCERSLLSMINQRGTGSKIVNGE
jgi:hypothetical protein